MRTMAITAAIWIDKPIVDMIRRIAERFERINHVETKVLTNPDLHGKFLSSAYYARYHVWEHVPADVDRIIWFDIDMIPLRPLPELPDVDFAAAPERQKIKDECGAAWPVLQRAPIYFNNGFMIAKRSTEYIFKRMALRQTHAPLPAMPWIVDQSFLNVEVFSEVEAGHITFKALDRRWNSIILLDEEPPPEDPYMLHFAGGHWYRIRIMNHAVMQLESLEHMVEIRKRYNRAK